VARLLVDGDEFPAVLAFLVEDLFHPAGTQQSLLLVLTDALYLVFPLRQGRDKRSLLDRRSLALLSVSLSGFCLSWSAIAFAEALAARSSSVSFFN
jgi:hypothetical protein